MTLPPTNPPSSQGTLAELGRHYEMFAEERDRLFPAHPAAPPALDRIDAVLNRLSYWSGVFSMFGQAARASEQNQDYDLPYHLLSVQHEILSLQSIYGQMKTAALVPRPAPVAQPAAPQAAPAPPAPAVMPKDPLYEDRRIREVIRTNQNKSFDYAQLMRRSLLNGVPFFVASEAGADVCGAIHPSCGHSARIGRCDLKMAHSVVSNQPTHHCNMCGQGFGR